jgi:endonuclease/exonuclease/phosphatase family metal-dependent hydrolase
MPGGDGPHDVHNLVLLSRWPVGVQRQIHHDLVAPWRWSPPVRGAGPGGPVEVRWDRPILQARVDPPGGPPLHLLNLHLRASRAAHIEGVKQGSRWRSTAAWAEGFCLAAQKQVGQALEARLAVEMLLDADPGAHVLVCGDLNADAHEMPVRMLCAAPEDVGDPAMAERSLEPLEGRLPESRRYSVRHAGRPAMLDHILASPAAAEACVGVEILNEALSDEVLEAESEPGSLHAAMAASFRWPGA